MRDDDALRALAASQHNLIERSQARDLGLRREEWRRMAASNLWVPVTDRVLRLAGGAPARGERVMAAVLDAGVDAMAAYTTGAWCWGVPGFAPLPVQLLTTHPTRHATTLAIVHRARELSERWRTVVDGIPVVRPEVVMLHLAATEHPRRVARALDNAWNLRLLSGRSLMAFLADYGERGRNGTAVLRDLVDERGEDYTPPASNLEARAMELFERVGLCMARQIDSGGDDWTGRVDFRSIDHRRLIVEVQSERYHSALLDRAADDARRAQLEDDGFVVVEVTDVELWHHSDVVLDRLRTAIRGLARPA